MPRRRGRPGLIGTAARTAVVVGTANAMTGSAQRRGMQQQAASAPAPTDQGDLIGKLKELADLKSAGVLTDEEFSAAKGRLLG